MPVTELAFLPTNTPGAVPPALHALGRTALAAQDAWCAAHAGPAYAVPAPQRGAAVWQQREDGGTALVTAHWASAAQHRAWVASDANRAAWPPMAPFLRGEDVVLFHVAEAELLPETTVRGGKVVVVGRCRMRAERRPAFEAVLRGNGPAGGAEGGWRIEKEDGTEEYVFVKGCESEEEAAAFVEGEGEGVEMLLEALRGAAEEVEVRSYTRIV
ncbi:hypothetical protein F4780DRAFT_735648 [Xylariomycetidae sp. FL0641]|nr:hypothetical protein F4780DRAFT_735648 [Xylariomycetidae sp. FL0641]